MTITHFCVGAGRERHKGSERAGVELSAIEPFTLALPNLSFYDRGMIRQAVACCPEFQTLLGFESTLDHKVPAEVAGCCFKLSRVRVDISNRCGPKRCRVSIKSSWVRVALLRRVGRPLIAYRTGTTRQRTGPAFASDFLTSPTVLCIATPLDP